jgi:hypothetical protein
MLHTPPLSGGGWRSGMRRREDSEGKYGSAVTELDVYL